MAADNGGQAMDLAAIRAGREATYRAMVAQVGAAGDAYRQVCIRASQDRLRRQRAREFRTAVGPFWLQHAPLGLTRKPDQPLVYSANRETRRKVAHQLARQVANAQRDTRRPNVGDQASSYLRGLRRGLRAAVLAHIHHERRTAGWVRKADAFRRAASAYRDLGA